MTLVGVGLRRTLTMLLAAALLFAITVAVSAPSADAAYPGGSDWIVFENSHDLWVMPADGTGAPVNATNTAYFEADPVFSADGTKLAFARDVEGSSAIWVASFNPATGSVSAEGTWVQVSSGPIDGEPTWSPDGLTIAFQRAVRTRYFTGTTTTADATGLTLTDTAATFVTDGVQAGDPVVNVTDGSSSTVLTIDGETQITLAAALTGGTSNQWGLGDAYTLGWSHRQIFKAPANGSTPAGTRLSASGSELLYDDGEPAWSPDGSLIAFSTSRNGNSDIYTFDTTGASPANLTDDAATGVANHATRPSWSPDGQYVAFQAAEPYPVTDSNIWRVDKAGTTPTQVTGASSTGTDEDVEPVWSPSGTKIAFRRSGTGGDKVWAINANGSGAATRIGSFTTPAISNEPDWQPALTAVNDSYGVAEGGTLNVPAAGVLTNDLTLVSSVGAATASKVTNPAHGTATVNSNGSLTYVNNGSENTTDSFTYQVTQGSFTSQATVTITITPVDDNPVAVADGPYNVLFGGTINVPAPGVLGNDSDAEGGALTAQLGTDVTHGSLTLNSNGSFSYTHDGSTAMSDSFTYQAKDPGGNLSSAVAVSIAISDTLPAINVAVSGPPTGAPGVKATFTSTVSGGTGSYTYAWSITSSSVEVATGTMASIDFTPTLGGSYVVSLTASDTSGSEVGTADFKVLGDIGGNTFVNDIIWLADEGITKGCNPPANDLFCPSSQVTRGQMAAFLVRFLGLTDDGGGNTFVDDNGSIFEADIAKLAAAGITKGCNPPANDMFCPNDSVTRGQMAAFLVRALGLTDDGGGNTFVDDNGSIFEADIARLAAAGITKGCNPPTNDMFCPNDSVTRGQMAAFIHRADGIATP